MRENAAIDGYTSSTAKAVPLPLKGKAKKNSKVLNFIIKRNLKILNNTVIKRTEKEKKIRLTASEQRGKKIKSQKRS